MLQIRQGDVYVQSIDRLPEGLTIKPRDRGRVVLAYGEVTGHAHAIDSPLAELFEDRDGALYLRVHAGGAPAQLVHEEHSALTLPPGAYLVTHQREYTPEAIRRVAD